ncbi:hypothetical protein BJY52DRAFT_1273430 [Lactarius psammicola]|nr:hypothetical protein BJY52DRAFT_1273430 [Lactarius psammicola]
MFVPRANFAISPGVYATLSLILLARRSALFLPALTSGPQHEPIRTNAPLVLIVQVSYCKLSQPNLPKLGLSSFPGPEVMVPGQSFCTNGEKQKLKYKLFRNQANLSIATICHEGLIQARV